MKDINKGKVWINNGLISKRVYVSEVESWIAKGYTKGFLRKYGDKKWINNGKL